MRRANHLICLVITVLFSLLFAAEIVCSQPKDMGGWGEDSAYNKLYKPTELDKFRCTVEKVIEVVPMEGMSPGIALIADEGDGEEFTIHVGPKWFLGDSIGIRRGDRIKIRGSWAEINGEDVFMAAKIKRGDYFVLKVRLTKNGKPFWTMSPEELAKEREEVE